MTVHSRLLRGCVIGKAAGYLDAGTHLLKFAVSPAAAARAASLELTLANAARAEKVAKKTVIVAAA